MRTFLLKSFFVTAIISPLLFPGVGTASCDLEKVLVSLDVKDKQIAEILKDIEKQAKFAIEVQDNKALTNKKSITLNQVPLDLTLNRLLKDINHSTICNNEKKTISLVLLDKGSHPSSTLAQRKSDGPQTNSMAGLSKAMDDYRNNKSSIADTSQQEPKEMKGIASALQSYKTNNEKDAPMPHEKKTSMDGATDALEQYKNNKQNSNNVTSAENNGAGGMTDLTTAMNEYRNIDPSKQPAPSTGKSTSMDGATTAMEEYRKIHNNR
jgi:hypothetical protein